LTEQKYNNNSTLVTESVEKEKLVWNRISIICIEEKEEVSIS